MNRREMCGKKARSEVWRLPTTGERSGGQVLLTQVGQPGECSGRGTHRIEQLYKRDVAAKSEGAWHFPCLQRLRHALIRQPAADVDFRSGRASKGGNKPGSLSISVGREINICGWKEST
jgi:hypothetical protein